MRFVLLLWLIGLLPAWGSLTWDRLPDLPDREGFAGVFSGIVKEGEEEFLVVAGGANFPEASRANTGKEKTSSGADLTFLPNPVKPAHLFQTFP